MNIIEAVHQARYAMSEAFGLVKEFVDVKHKDPNNRTIIYNLQGIFAKIINDNINHKVEGYMPPTYQQDYYESYNYPQPVQEPLKDDPKEAKAFAIDMDKAVEEGREDVKEARKKIK
jgi:hypothetical protein